MSVQALESPKTNTCPNCGGPMKHRSEDDHEMFWAILHRAYENWPENHGFKPDNKSHLYGWLLIEAGHKDCVEVETTDKSVAISVARAMFSVTKREIHCMRVFGTPTGVRICVPKSLSYKSAGKKQYEGVRSVVYEIIETALGVKVETLKRARSA